MRASLSDIRKVDVFEDIDESTLEKLCDVGEILRLQKNASLYQDRQILNSVYFLLSGKVSLCKTNENGESKVIFLLSGGKIINQPLMRKNTSSIECWGFEDSTILRVGFEEFDKIMSQDYTLARNCMIFMEYRIRSLYRQLKNSVTINIDKKLAAKLYRLASEYGKVSDKEGFTYIDVPLTNTYLSKMLGCQRESISRAMKSLRSKSIVKTDGRKIYIDMEKSKELFNA